MPGRGAAGGKGLRAFAACGLALALGCGILARLAPVRGLSELEGVQFLSGMLAFPVLLSGTCVLPFALCSIRRADGLARLVLVLHVIAVSIAGGLAALALARDPEGFQSEAFWRGAFVLTAALSMGAFLARLSVLCWRDTLVAYRVTMVVGLVAGTVFWSVGWSLERAVRHEARRLDPLLDALLAFREDMARPVEHLPELVPRYLAVLPEPAFGDAQFEYERRGGEFALRYEVRGADLSGSWLVYDSAEPFAQRGAGGAFGPIGRWAFIGH